MSILNINDPNLIMGSLQLLSNTFGGSSIDSISYIDYDTKNGVLHYKTLSHQSQGPNTIPPMIDSIKAVHDYLKKTNQLNEDRLQQLSSVCYSLRTKTLRAPFVMDERDKTCFLGVITLLYRDLKPNKDIKFIIDSTTAIDALSSLKNAFENTVIFSSNTCYEYLKYERAGHILKKIPMKPKSIDFLNLSIEAVYQYLAVDGITRQEHSTLSSLICSLTIKYKDLQTSLQKLSSLNPKLQTLNEAEVAINQLSSNCESGLYKQVRLFFNEYKERAGEIPSFEDSFLIAKLNICLKNLKNPLETPQRLSPLYKKTELNLSLLKQLMKNPLPDPGSQQIYKTIISDLNQLCPESSLRFLPYEDKQAINVLNKKFEQISTSSSLCLEPIPKPPTSHPKMPNTLPYPQEDFIVNIPPSNPYPYSKKRSPGKNSLEGNC